MEEQSIIKNDDGTPVLSEDGLPHFERKKFDICGKKYSDLPEELKERFNDYTFECTQNLNCSDEDIVIILDVYDEGKRG